MRLLKGFSGIRAEVLERFAYMVNNRIHPVIPQQGSLGCFRRSRAIISSGTCITRRRICLARRIACSSCRYLERAWHVEPIVLEAKEGLALINGTQAMTAQGVVNYLEAESLAYA